MARNSLRKYLTAGQLLEINPLLVSIDNSVLIQAEIDIDNIIASHLQGAFSQYFTGFSLYNSTSVVLTSTGATITGLNLSDGFLAYTTLEIVSGANAGSRFLIKSNINGVLTYFDTDSLSTGSEAVKIYQIGKCPMLRDVNGINNIIYKSIHQDIKEAVALQYEFRIKNAGSIDNQYASTSYSVSGDSFSENFNPTLQNSIRERISPQAFDILNYLTAQSL